MAGASFKGNLEVLNLSDIFQSLAMNRHSGTLVVSDGKRQKKIYFAEGEIALLSSSRRMKLGELLISTGKITEEDLDLALKLQKQNRKKLGEILVEEGFCDEDDIARIVRCQIEEEIYDLFLWRKAEFEFNADYMPEDLKRNSPDIMRLTLNTNALIMEALRRLDEWELIKEAVPSTKEIFILVDKKKVDKIELPERLRGEIHNIDGKTNVEQIAERALISEFELCKLLADLVKAGGIRSLSTEELVQKAEEAYALNEFVAAAALYGRLAEIVPGEPKVLIPLADSVRRTGDDRQALVLYEEITRRLDAGRDAEKLRRCYEAMIALDPDRHDLVRKLEDLDQRAKTKRKAGIALPMLVVVGVVVGGGALVFQSQIKKFVAGFGRSDDAKHEQDEKLARDLLELAKRDEAEAKRDKSKYPLWFGHGFEIVKNYPKTAAFKEVRLPLLVRTVPPSLEVYLNGTFQGYTTAEDPVVVALFSPVIGQDKVQLQIKRKRVPGRPEPPWIGEPRVVTSNEFREETFTVEDRHETAFGVDGNVETEVAFFGDSGKRVVGTSRAGHFHYWDVDKSAQDWLRLQVGDQGDTLTAPLVIDKRAYVGTVDKGVVAIDLTEDKLGKLDAGKFPTDGVVISRLFAPAKPGRTFVAATRNGQVSCWSADGGRPLWERRTEGPLDFTGALTPPSTDPQLFVVGSNDEQLYAFDAQTGKPPWPPCVLGTRPLGPPCPFQNLVLVPVENGIVAVSTTDGKVKDRYSEPQSKAVKGLIADDVRLYVALDGAKVRALDPRSGWKALWPEDFTVQGMKGTPRIGFFGERVAVSFDDPRIYGLDPKTGGISWIGTLENGRVSSPCAWQGDFLAVGSTLFDVQLFRRPQ